MWSEVWIFVSAGMTSGDMPVRGQESPGRACFVEKKTLSVGAMPDGSPREMKTVEPKGTFHGLGALDASPRALRGNLDRLQVEMLEGPHFIYASTGQECTAQETLFHLFGVPVDVLAEPRQWYIWEHSSR